MQAIEIRRIPTVRVGAVLLALALLIPAVEARAATYELADDGSTQFVGEDTHLKTRYEDTLYDLARQYGVGSEEITSANPKVDPWLPGAGTEVVIPGRRILPPGPREGIVVNIAEHRLYYYPRRRVRGHRLVITYPVSIGKMDWKTPLGLTRIIQKVREGDPIPKIVRAGPDNPLGAFAMRLAVQPGDYLIHGTNNPLAVGMPVTHGCIRMYPEDVAALFPTVPVGTPVRLINDPLKVVFVDGQLWLEVHAPVDAQGQTVAPEVKDLEPMLDTALGNTTTAIDWDYALQTLKLANGIAVTVGLQADLDSSPQTQQTSAGGQPAAPDAGHVAPANQQTSTDAQPAAPDAGHEAPADQQTSTDAQPRAAAPPASAPGAPPRPPATARSESSPP
jgi:L,D-transpeptidase ErfK/SrfK